MLTGVTVRWRCKIARAFKNKKVSKAALVLAAIYKKYGVFKYQKVLQCGNGPEFKSDATYLLEKDNADLPAQS